MTYYSTELLETMRDNGGSIGSLAEFALNQRECLTRMEAKITGGDPLGRQVRDLTAENKRLRRIIAELESR